MTPEERQLLTALATRIKAAPAQQKDQEAEALLRQLVEQRPDTAYMLAQTVLMQDFALRNAQAQITDLQRQLDEARRAPPAPSSGSFLGGLFGGTSPQPAPTSQYRPPGPSSVPRSGPWTRSAPRPAYPTAPGAPVLQPAQSSGFLQQAATTAVGIAGGALLFEGIQSLFGPHYGCGFGGGFLGGSPWGGAGWGPGESLSETTIVNNNYGDQPQDQARDQGADDQPDTASDQDGGFQDAGYDSSQDVSDGGDFGGGGDDFT